MITDIEPIPSARDVYRQMMMDVICEKLIGGQSLRSICRDNESLPHISTIMVWLNENAKLAEQYARAKELQADTYNEEIVDIADNISKDIVMTPFGPQIDGFAAKRAQVMIEARKWVMGRARPKKYGDKITIEGNVKGGDIITNNTLIITPDDAKRAFDAHRAKIGKHVHET